MRKDDIVKITRLLRADIVERVPVIADGLRRSGWPDSAADVEEMGDEILRLRHQYAVACRTEQEHRRELDRLRARVGELEGALMDQVRATAHAHGHRPDVIARMERRGTLVRIALATAPSPEDEP